MNVESYSPVQSSNVALAAGEKHTHSFRMRGWRWTLGVRDPETLRGLVHLTTKRMVIETDAGETAAMLWDDVIEFEQIDGTRALESLFGAEEHMLHAVAKTPLMATPDQVFLFEVEPVPGGPRAQRPEHCARFVEIADDLIVDAFGEG